MRLSLVKMKSDSFIICFDFVLACAGWRCLAVSSSLHPGYKQYMRYSYFEIAIKNTFYYKVFINLISITICRAFFSPNMHIGMWKSDSLHIFACLYVSQMCPGIQHLNIGQVPKITKSSLEALTARLKCLISLNLTGLQVDRSLFSDLICLHILNVYEMKALS